MGRIQAGRGADATAVPRFPRRVWRAGFSHCPAPAVLMLLAQGE